MNQPVPMTLCQRVKLALGGYNVRVVRQDRGPKDPFPFKGHRTLAEVWQIEPAKEQPA